MDDIHLKGGVDISISLDGPPQIVFIYSNKKNAISAFEDMRKKFGKLHLIK